MLISHNRNIIRYCCSIFYTTVSLGLVLTEIDIPEGLADDKEDCVENFYETGNFSLNIKENCDVYYLNLDFEDPTSIINVTTSIQHSIQVAAHLTEQSSDLNPTFNMKLNEFDRIEKNNVLLEEWKGNPTTTVPWTYLSRSSNVSMEISLNGNWSHYEIIFSFNEIPYNLIQLEPSEQTEVKYRPNSVSLLLLDDPETAWKGIKIWFANLTINTEMGEYILIGKGTEVFKSNHSRPLYITEVTENSTFFVDHSSAFVAFVAGSVEKEMEQFNIFWKGIEKIAEPEEPEDSLKTSLICFYNYSAAKQEYDDKNSRFQQEFLRIAKKYLLNNDETINLEIQLLGEPTTKNNNGLEILIVLMKVVDRGKPIFTWKELQIIIGEFEQISTSLLGYKVGKCPTDQFDLPYKDKWHYVIYASVPLVGLFALMTWAWKHKLFTQNCLTEKKEKLSFDNIHAEPNTYEDSRTIPNAYRSEEEGRRESLIRSSSQEDTAVKNTTMVEMNAIPSTSQDTLKRFLSSNRRRSRPSIKPLINNVEENNKQTHSTKNEGDESDHLYDSVSSSKQLDETKL